VESCDIQITRIGRGLQKYIHHLNHIQYLKPVKSIIYAKSLTVERLDENISDLVARLKAKRYKPQLHDGCTSQKMSIRNVRSACLYWKIT